MVTKAEILRFLPSARPALVEAIVANWGVAEAEGEILTPARIQHFFSNIAVETGGLKAVEENLNYTTAAQIVKTWPTRFRSIHSAEPFVRDPEALAIKVYGGRYGNAPAPSTDGWDYRGGGMLQTTFRDNYAALGYESNPEALRDPDTAFLMAVAEWKKRGCNALADAGKTEAVRRKINGGVNGLAEVKAYLKKAQAVWPSAGSGIVKKVEAKPRPAAPSIADKKDASPALIKQVQLALIEKGYPEVGIPEGKYGSKTRGAILAFEADHALPLTGKVTPELWEAINAAEGREIAPSRAEGKPEDKTVLRASNGQTVIASGMGILAVPSLAEPVLSRIEGLSGIVTRLKASFEPLNDFIAAAWPVLAVLAAGVVLYLAITSRRKVIDDFQTGKITR